MITLEVITPSSVILAKEVESVSVPTTTGQIGVLPGHISLVSELSTGILKYKENNKDSAVAIHYGYVEVNEDKVTLITEIAEAADQIDQERAKKAQENAEKVLKGSFSSKSEEGKDMTKYQSKLMRSLTRQEAAKH